MSTRPETTTHDADPDEDGRTITITWTTTTCTEYTASFSLAEVLEAARRDTTAKVTDVDGQVLLGELTTDNWGLDMLLSDHEDEDVKSSVDDVERTISESPELTTG